jgi:NADH dehydrogenase
VVVLGAGFAGLQVATALKNKPVSVTVIDHHNHHVFQPLLYQVATAALEPADIAGPIRQVLRGNNLQILLDEARSVDVERKCVRLTDRALPYDFLVVATGSTHSYFGHPEWASVAPGLKTLEDAMEIRRRVLFAFEAAERCTHPQARADWLTFVVVGGGPTGVELAGALAEIARGTHAREFRNFDPAHARILLIEGLPRVLTTYSEELSAKARRSLERLGVIVQLDTKVTNVSDGYVVTPKGRIGTKTVLWAAGVAASPIARSLGTELDRAGRVRVTRELTVKEHPEVYVVGDLASLEQDGEPLPGLAPVAMAEGKHAAKNIQRTLAGKPLMPFHYWNRGAFAVIGRGAAIGVAFKRMQLSGYVAWLAWLVIHIVFLVGFRNRLAVLFNWAYVYFTRRRHAQLIVGEVPAAKALKPAERGEASAPQPIVMAK